MTTSPGLLPSWLRPSAQCVSVSPTQCNSRQWWPAQALAAEPSGPSSIVNGTSLQQFHGAAVQDEGDSVEQLAALCMQANNSDSVNQQFGVPATELLARRSPTDSTGTASLRPVPHVKEEQQLEACVVEQQEGAQVLEGSLEPKGTATVNLALVAAPSDACSDTPLPSVRKNFILDIMSGKVPHKDTSDVSNAAVTSPPLHRLPFLQSTVSSVSTGSSAFLIGTGVLSATASGSSAGSVPPWGLSTTASDAYMPGALSAASTSGVSVSALSGSSSSLAAPSVGVGRVLFVGVFLTPESREVLLSMAPAVHLGVHGDHVTLVYKPSVQQLLAYPVGAEVELRVLGAAANGRVQAVFVDLPCWLQTLSASAHVTISVAPGAQAKEAGQLTADALQEAAKASDYDLVQAGPGGYQHWDEPLLLAGWLGVKVALPASKVVSMGWGSRCPELVGSVGAGVGVLQDQEVELVLYRVEELVAAGCCSIDTDALKAFYSQHGRHLGTQMPPGFHARPPALPCVPEVTPAYEASPSLNPATPHPAASSPAALTADGSTPVPTAQHSPAAPPAAAAVNPCLPAGYAVAASSSPVALPHPYGAFAVAAAAAAGPAQGCGYSSSLHSAAVGSASGQLALPSIATLSGAAAAAETERGSAAAAADSPRSVSSGGSGSSSSSLEAVQFLQCVHTGDYVAVRPLVPAEGGPRLQQGYVQEFACEEPFQADGVLVVLDDNTIGYVAMVLDSQHGSGPGHAADAGMLASGAAAGGSKRCASGMDHAASGDLKGGKAVLMAYPVDPSTAPGSSSSGIGPAAGAAGAAGFTGGSGLQGPIQEWMAAASGLEPLEVAVTPDVRRRNAREAERDLQLWREFETLQRQHGEELCSTILEACNQDFEEAIALIKGQDSRLALGAAAAGAGAAGTAADASPVLQQGAAAVPRAASPVAAASGPAADEALVQQLALSLGLLPTDALQLARLVPEMPAEAVVQELQRAGGDVGVAADALLSRQQAAAVVAPTQEGSAGSSPVSSPVGSAGGRSGGGVSPEARVVRGFLSCPDPARVAAAQQLREMSPGLSFEMAELLLQEHGGRVDEAAQALSDMQARELQARTAASAQSNSFTANYSSSSNSPVLLRPAATSSPAAFTPASIKEAGHSQGSSGQASPAGLSACGLSEADQLAILTAMGELEAAPQEPALLQTPTHKAGPSTSHSQRSPVRLASSPPRCQPPALAMAGPEYYYSSPGTSRQPPPPQAPRPPPPPPPAQRAAIVASFIDMEAQRAAQAEAKAAADAYYAKATNLTQAADVYMAAAQDLLRAADKAGYKEQFSRANDLRQQARQAIEAAQRVAWSKNNMQRNCWEVDLHGLSVARAISKFEKQFRALRLMDHPGGVLLRVVVGQGHHSEGNVPKIKLGVLQYLDVQQQAALQETGKHWGVTWEVDPGNPGVVNVHIPAAAADDDVDDSSN